MNLTPSPNASQAALLLIDLQPGIIENSHTCPAKKIRLATEVAVKIAALLKMPAFASLVPVSAKAPKPVDELKELPRFTRHVAGAFDHSELREAIRATGRKVLGIGGVVSEIAVLQGALTAMREGYAVHVLVDCCGGATERTEQAAFQQLQAAGAFLSSIASFYTTLENDFSTPEGRKMLGLLQGLMAKD